MMTTEQQIPKQLFVEPTNLCNANCIFCGYQFNQDPKVVMPFDMFDAICKEYRAMGGTHLNVTPYSGEVLTDNDFLKKINRARDYGFEHIATYTNLILLDRFSLDDFLESGITHLAISLAPLEKTLYEKMFRCKQYDRVLSNIEDLLEAFHQTNNKTIQRVDLSFRSERPMEMVEELGDFSRIKPYIYGGVSTSCMLEYDSWMGMIQQEDLHPGMRLKSAEFEKPYPCDRLFMLKVKADGTMRACGCRYDYSKLADTFEIGKYGEMSLLEAYNSSVVHDLKDSFTQGKLYSECEQCSWYEHFRYSGG